MMLQLHSSITGSAIILNTDHIVRIDEQDGTTFVELMTSSIAVRVKESASIICAAHNAQYQPAVVTARNERRSI